MIDAASYILAPYFRISKDEEVSGIDLAVHAERGYELTDNTQGSVNSASKGV